MKTILILLLSAATVHAGDACKAMTKGAFKSCQLAAKSDYELALAKCANIADAAARKACEADAKMELADAQDTCKEQLALRQVVCDKLGGGVYDPVIVPANFTTNITNQYFPLTPGKARIYVANT